MGRVFLLSLLVVGVAAALVVGAYSAMAGGGPVAGVAGAVIGADADTVSNQDAEGEDVDAQDSDGEVGEGAKSVAGAIGDAFGVSQEDVLALHERGIGFGALFKLYALAAATGASVDDLMASATSDGDGELEFAFGELRKTLTDEQQAALESGPKNLGQLMKAAKDAGADADGVVAAVGLEKANEKFAASGSDGHGRD